VTAHRTFCVRLVVPPWLSSRRASSPTIRGKRAAATRFRSSPLPTPVRPRGSSWPPLPRPAPRQVSRAPCLPSLGSSGDPNREPGDTCDPRRAAESSCPKEVTEGASLKPGKGRAVSAVVCLCICQSCACREGQTEAQLCTALYILHCRFCLRSPGPLKAGTVY
jgi:hypothetical protein